MDMEYTPITQKLTRFFRKIWPILITYTILIILLLLTTGILALIYNLLYLIFPSFLCWMAILFISYKTIKYICRMITFPGSIFLWKRSIENNFSRTFSNRFQAMIQRLESITQFILDKKTFTNYVDAQEIYAIRNLISSLLNNYNKQKEYTRLSTYQSSFYNILNILEKTIKEVNVVFHVEPMEIITYWKFFELYVYENTMFTFENESEAKKIIELCKNLENRLNELISDKNWFHSIYRWLYDDTLGTIDHIREDLTTTYEGERISILVEKNITLDCLLIKANFPEENDEFNQPLTSIELKEKNSLRDEALDVNDPISKKQKYLGPTMIFCNPNGGCYELMYFENERLGFYLNRGISLFLWNYRGYGRSKGIPSPRKLKADGEIIVDYIRKTYNVKKLGVHGVSLGGMVACHTAKVKNLDFLCADRTFSSLSQVALEGFGKIMHFIYTMITRWTDDSSNDYLEASCYKMLTFDPKDEVIPLIASLKFGVSTKLIERKFGIKPQPGFYAMKTSSNKLSLRNTWLTFVRIILNIQTQCKKYLNQSKIDQHFESLTPQHLHIIFCSLNRISSLFQTLNIKTNRGNNTEHSTRAEQPDSGKNSSKNKFKKPARELDYLAHCLGPSSANSIQPNLNNIQLEPNFTIEDETVMGMIKHSLKTQDESLSYYENDSKIFGDLNSEPKTLVIDEKTLVIVNSKSYAHLFNEEIKKSDEIMKFIWKIYSIFEAMEAGAIHLTDLKSKKRKTNLKIFKEFIRSLEIWGSYEPIKNISIHTPKDFSYFYMNSLNKIKDFVRRIDNLVALQKKRSLSTLEIKIIDDLEIISTIFSTIYHQLHLIYNKHNKNNEEIKTIPNSIDDINLEIHLKNEVNHQKRPINNDITQKSFKEIEKIQDLATLSNLGNLLPLTCGHNGQMNKMERTLLDYHLRNSEFLK